MEFRAMMKAFFAATLIRSTWAVCDYDNCGDCIDATSHFGLVYHCYWCRIDQQCHAKGSMKSACYRAFDDSCVSQSKLMSCDYTSEDDCPAPDAHMSKQDTCDARARRLLEEASPPARRLITGNTFLSEAAHQEMIEARARAAEMGIREDHDGEVPLQDLAKMAYDVYELADKPSIEAKPPSGWKITYQEEQPFSGTTPYKEVALAVYENEDQKQAVIAFKGTSFTSSYTDVAIDLESIIGGTAPVGPLLTGARHVKTWQDKGFTVLLTGHSLGGYIAEVVSTTFGLAGVGFCAPGGGWHNGFKGGAGSGFRNVNHEHDPAGNVASGVFLHAQWSVYIEDWTATHSMGNMLQSMQERGPEWTNQNVACKCTARDTGYYTKRDVSRKRELSV